MDFRVLAVGDVCGDVGLQLLERRLRPLRRQYNVDFCVVNGENASGVGIIPRQAEMIFSAGADVITLGNHSYSRREIEGYLEDSPYILCPANDSHLCPGRGFGVYDTKAGPVAVVNLIGRCGMAYGPDNPFLLAEKLLKQIDTRIVLVDFHAEASSEKLALAYHLDGNSHPRPHGGQPNFPRRNRLCNGSWHDRADSLGAGGACGAVHRLLPGRPLPSL